MKLILSSCRNLCLSVRPLAAEDFDGFINWLGLSQAEIERLGVAIDRVPSAARMRSDHGKLFSRLAAPGRLGAVIVPDAGSA